MPLLKELIEWGFIYVGIILFFILITFFASIFIYLYSVANEDKKSFFKTFKNLLSIVLREIIFTAFVGVVIMAILEYIKTGGF